MADPDHQPELDDFDRLTVQLYRAGIVLVAFGLLCASVALVLIARGGPDAGLRPLHHAWWFVDVGVGLAIANLHLYDKRFRWLFGMLAWGGVLFQLMAVLQPPLIGAWIFAFGLGLVFACASAIALKEQLCFRIPGLRLVPAALALSVPVLLAQASLVAAPLVGLAGALFALLAIAKLRMPYGHDVGDRSRYQL